MLRKPLAVLLVLAPLAGCAPRPAYFGEKSCLLRLDGARYWEAPAGGPPYLQARMRRPLRSAAPETTLYEGTLSLASIAPVVMLSTFSVAEGSSATFRFEFNAGVARELARSGRATSYSPGGVVVVVSCARGECGADAEPGKISPDGRIALITKDLRRPRAPRRPPKSAARLALEKDVECTALHDGLRLLEEADAPGRPPAPGPAGARARLKALRAERVYARKGCAAWLEERGGVEAAERRVRLSRWTSFRGK